MFAEPKTSYSKFLFTGRIVEQCAATNAAYGASTNMRTKTVYYPEGLPGEPDKVKSVTYPDARKDSYTNEYGIFYTNSTPSLCVFSNDASGCPVEKLHPHENRGK